jgi:predicted ester cyclase
MPSTDNKALTRRWFEEVWNKSRESAISEMLTPNCNVHGLEETGSPLTGPQAFLRFYRQFRSGFPDVKVTVDQVIAEGDMTAARFTGRATHGGDGLGVQATGAVVTVSGLCMIRWEGGRIAEAWNEFDAAGLMRQVMLAAAATGGAGAAGGSAMAAKPKVKA